jgi:hypothetical protein
MRLRYIETVDFRQSEATNFAEIMRKRKLHLGPDDVVLLVNKGRDQLVFVYDIKELVIKNGVRKEYTVLTSVRHRLDHGTWNPLMIRNYAEISGLKLDGLRRFEEHYQHLLSGDGGKHTELRRRPRVAKA